MTEKIKKLRDRRALDLYPRYDDDGIYWSNADGRKIFREGFDACWALHEKLVGPLIEQLEHFGGSFQSCRETFEKYKSEVGE